jgi:hypothetical protein
MSGFWRRWLSVWCWAVCALGAALMGGAFEATSGPSRLLLQVAGGWEAAELDRALRFALGLMGAVTFGWGLTWMAAIRAAHQLGAAGRPIWGLLTVGAMAWFVVDSAISIATGFTLNAVSNAGFVAAFLLPVLRCGMLRDASGSVATAQASRPA